MSRRAVVADLLADPFQERADCDKNWRTPVLGVPFHLESNSAALLRIARQAFERLPRHRLRDGSARPLRITLRRVADAHPGWTSPPRPNLSSGNGLLCALVDGNNFVVIDPRAHSAFVQVEDRMLRHPRLMRYELIEFAANTLAARVHGLVPLHAGCVGDGRRGLLLLGTSGAGKSLLTLHAAFGGLEFLAEDSVFVDARTLRATGLSAFVHPREDALPSIGYGLRTMVRRSPRILRRSGASKHEVDLRGGRARLARRPPRIVSTVVLSAERPARSRPVVRLNPRQLRRVLRDEQPYGVAQPSWGEFERGLLRAGGYRLARLPPEEAVHWLRCILRGDVP